MLSLKNSSVVNHLSVNQPKTKKSNHDRLSEYLGLTLVFEKLLPTTFPNDHNKAFRILLRLLTSQLGLRLLPLRYEGETNLKKNFNKEKKIKKMIQNDKKYR